MARRCGAAARLGGGALVQLCAELLHVGRELGVRLPALALERAEVRRGAGEDPFDLGPVGGGWRVGGCVRPKERIPGEARGDQCERPGRRAGAACCGARRAVVMTPFCVSGGISNSSSGTRIVAWSPLTTCRESDCVGGRGGAAAGGGRARGGVRAGRTARSRWQGRQRAQRSVAAGGCGVGRRAGGPAPSSRPPPLSARSGRPSRGSSRRAGARYSCGARRGRGERGRAAAQPVRLPRRARGLSGPHVGCKCIRMRGSAQRARGGRRRGARVACSDRTSISQRRA